MLANSQQIPLVPRPRPTLWRHKKKMLLVFCLILTAVGVFLVYAPRTYYSEATLFVRVGRESVTLDPTATPGDTIQVAATREAEITSVRDMLRNRAMLEKVVDTLGLDTFADPPAGAEESGTFRTLVTSVRQWLPQLDPIGPREEIINELERNTGVSSDRRSNLIFVHTEADTPELAQKIAQALVNVYLEEHARLNRASGCYTFFAQQAVLLGEKLTQAADDLSRAKNEMGLLSIEGQRQRIETHLNTLTTDLLRSRAALAAAEGRINSLTKTLAGVPERLTTDEIHGYPNMAADQMRRVLYELEIREAELASKFAPDYPLLVAIRKQIQEAKSIHAEQEPQRTQWTSAINSVHQQLQTNLLTERANQDSFRAQVASLEQQHTVAQQQLKSLNDHEARIARLQREVDVLEASSKTYSQKMEQSRIDEELRRERITNVNVVQPASFVEKPASPKKQLVLAAGVAVAAFGAIGIALLAEYLGGGVRQQAPAEELIVQHVVSESPARPRKSRSSQPVS